METLYYSAVFFTALPIIFMVIDLSVNGKEKNFPHWMQEVLSGMLVLTFGLWIIYFSCNLFA